MEAGCVKKLVENCRSYRRFFENDRIGEENLKELVDLARLTASTANSQALKYRLVFTEEECEKLFPCIGWAGALPDWDGPEKGERPSGYIVICCDLRLGKNKMWDNGITAQTMMLGAGKIQFGFAFGSGKAQGKGGDGSGQRGRRYPLLPGRRAGALCAEEKPGRCSALIG